MSLWLLTYKQGVFKRYITVTTFLRVFTYKMAAKINWHRYETKLRDCHPMYSWPFCATWRHPENRKCIRNAATARWRTALRPFTQNVWWTLGTWLFLRCARGKTDKQTDYSQADMLITNLYSPYRRRSRRITRSPIVIVGRPIGPVRYSPTHCDIRQPPAVG